MPVTVSVFSLFYSQAKEANVTAERHDEKAPGHMILSKPIKLVSITFFADVSFSTSVEVSNRLA